MLNTFEPVLYICGALIFALLRMLDGCDKIPRFAMCMGMAGTLIFMNVFNGNNAEIGCLKAAAMLLALLWAFSYGWSHTSINTMLDAYGDWVVKFQPSGTLVLGIARKLRLPNTVLGAIGWTPRIIMTFWLPCALCGNIWAVFPLAAVWGWLYWIGGKINLDHGVRIGEGLTALALFAALTSKVWIGWL
jgi:hypothetical protein